MKIGITGNLGSGKSTFAKQLFLQNQHMILEMDDVRRDILWNIHSNENILFRKKISEDLNISLRDEILDRQELEHYIFSSSQNRAQFNSYFYPIISDIIQTHDDIIFCWTYLLEENYLRLLEHVFILKNRKLEFNDFISNRQKIETTLENKIKILENNIIPFTVLENKDLS